MKSLAWPPPHLLHLNGVILLWPDVLQKEGMVAGAGCSLSAHFQSNQNVKVLKKVKTSKSNMTQRLGKWSILPWQISLSQCGYVWFVLDLSQRVVKWRSLAVSYSLLWYVVLLVETRVSSSGETWQAKLIEMVINQCGPGVGSHCSWIICMFPAKITKRDC